MIVYQPDGGLQINIRDTITYYSSATWWLLIAMLKVTIDLSSVEFYWR